MKMIWQLFGVHISLTLILLLLLIAWLAWPRKHVKFRKALLKTGGLILLGSLLLALYTYWPYEYEKKYLKDELSTELQSKPLKQLADSIDFHIGVAFSPDPSYHQNILKEFNSVVAENHFKPNKLLVDPANWGFDFSEADQLLNFSQSNGLRMRGHTLIWGKFPGMTFPKQWTNQINEATDQKAAMEALMTQYISTVMGHFKGRIHSWDVVNEPMGGTNLFPSIFTQAMGEAYIDYAFKLARQADPDCLLFLNEQIYDYQGPPGTAFVDLLQRLLDRGVPIDGVGLQSHHINRLHDIDGLKQYIRAIGSMGLKVEITELDIRLLLFDHEKDPYQAQGDQYKGIIKTCLDDPACTGVTLWGLTDGANWMDAIPPFKWKSPNAPNILDEDMRKKPAYVGVWEALKEAQAH